MPEDQFEKLARLITETAEETGEELRADIGKLRDEMKTGFAAVDRRFDGIEQQLADIKIDLMDLNARVEAVEANVASHTGFAKEIDHLLSRVSAIEKHLGITAAAER